MKDRQEKNIKPKEISALIEQQEYRCALSGRTLTPETASIDHIVPLSRGGEHAIHNLWAVHHQINAAKGTLTADDFLAMCRDVIRQQEQHRHGLSEKGPLS